MSIEVKQLSRIDESDRSREDLEGLDWWHWSVWLEGPDEELDKVEYVEYVLHPTFPKPVRRITDRATQFRLDSAGWGEFMIHVKVHMRAADTMEMEHWLQLRQSDADEKARPAKARATSSNGLFLSTSVADEPFADALQQALEKRGLKILRVTDDSNLPWQAALEGTLARSDGAILILSNNQSPWVKKEAEAVLNRKLPVVPIVIGSDTQRLLKNASLEKMASIQRRELGDLEASANEIADQLAKFKWL